MPDSLAEDICGCFCHGADLRMAEVSQGWQMRQALKDAVEVTSVAHVDESSPRPIWALIPAGLQHGRL